jgi:MOSC domain-containing protein YiiM
MKIEVESLAYQPSRSLNEPPYRYNRVPVQEVNLIAGHGIEGDLKAGHNPNRHINIMAREALDVLSGEGFRTAPGEMGEQMVIKGLDLMVLEPGTEIQLGDSAVIRLNTLRTGCSWLEQVQGREAQNAARNRLGWMATVIAGGAVHVGDPVRVLISESPR